MTCAQMPITSVDTNKMIEIRRAFKNNASTSHLTRGLFSTKKYFIDVKNRAITDF